MAERAPLVDPATAETPKIDISGFGPKLPAKPLETPVDAIRDASEKAGLVSREPASQKKSAKKLDRRRRTGRNIQLSAKISETAQELLDEIYESNRNPDGTAKWTIGQILEFGLEAFKRDLGRAGRDD
jgi:hypothetical protein